MYIHTPPYKRRCLYTPRTLVIIIAHVGLRVTQVSLHFGWFCTGFSVCKLFPWIFTHSSSSKLLNDSFFQKTGTWPIFNLLQDAQGSLEIESGTGTGRDANGCRDITLLKQKKIEREKKRKSMKSRGSRFGERHSTELRSLASAIYTA